MANLKVFMFNQDFGFINAGRKLKEDINGDFFLSMTDEEVIAESLPWVGAVRLRKAYVESLPRSVLTQVQ